MKSDYINALMLTTIMAFLCSCRGTKVIKDPDQSVQIKPPAMSKVMIEVKPDGLINVDVRPLPWWESVIQGVTGGVFGALTREEKKDDV